MGSGQTVDCDLVIVGAGLTGLSLACWLRQLSLETGQPLPSVQLLEPRLDYHNDRTWCFWDCEPTPFRSLISHRWSRWLVSRHGREVSQTGERTDYAMLPAGRVYQHAVTTIESCAEFELHRGVTVDDIDDSDCAPVVSAGTRRWRAQAVIDTRPPAPEQFTQGAGFWQVFTGYELHCPGHGYSTDTARLMDFQPCEGHVCFVYSLPLDQDHLLVEWTEFHPGGELPDCRVKLEAWLAGSKLPQYTVRRTESGALPMMPVSQSPHRSRVIRAGVGAGWMRAASGYHFATCQRNSGQLARQILNASASGDWRLQSLDTRSPWLSWMDRVFLTALRRYPEAAPDWFLDMFSATTGAQMARFMNDQPRWRDAMAVAAALPTVPFLRAALS